MKYYVITTEKYESSVDGFKTTTLREIEVDDCGNALNNAEEEFQKLAAKRLREKFKNEGATIAVLDKISFSETWYRKNDDVVELGFMSSATGIAEMILRGEL